VASAIAEMAGALSGSAGRNSLGLRAEFLTRHFDRALRLMSECLTEPAFVDQEVERERAALLQDIRSRDDSPAGAVFDLFTRTLYKVHPYRLDALGEEPSVKALKSAQLRALCGGPMHPSNLLLSIVGDVDPDRAFALCEELFGSSPGEPPPPPRVPVEPPQTGPRRSFKALDKAQAHLVYGFLGVTVRSEDRHALDVLSSVLSGQGGRLFVQLRDKQSLAYSVSSFSVEGIDPGYFGVYMGTSPDKVRAALAGIREQLDLTLQGPLPAADLERAKNYLIGTHAIALQKNGARAALMAYDEAYGMGADNYLRYQEHIAAVTAERVLEVARRTLARERGNLAILGSPAADVDLE
jgi:zinc protease